MSQIPKIEREIVRGREKDRCIRCAVPSPSGHWHHRRSRSVKDKHQHCACNGVWLCSPCHQWVHAHPFEARQNGLIVSRHTNDPGIIPMQSAWGWRTHDCYGHIAVVEREQE